MKIHLYVEGGPKGCNADGIRSFRSSFKQHLLRLDPRLVSLNVSPGGSTFETIRDFARAIKRGDPDCIVALLVDSEEAVTADSPAKHLASKLDSAGVPEHARVNVFLMVQCMEAWFLADRNALEECFGPQIQSIKFPGNPNVEAIAKDDVLGALDLAAKRIVMRRYNKIRDGSRILAKLDTALVASRSDHARRLHEFLVTSVQDA